MRCCSPEVQEVAPHRVERDGDGEEAEERRDDEQVDADLRLDCGEVEDEHGHPDKHHEHDQARPEEASHLVRLPLARQLHGRLYQLPHAHQLVLELALVQARLAQRRGIAAAAAKAAASAATAAAANAPTFATTETMTDLTEKDTTIDTSTAATKDTTTDTGAAVATTTDVTTKDPTIDASVATMKEKTIDTGEAIATNTYLTEKDTTIDTSTAATKDTTMMTTQQH